MEITIFNIRHKKKTIYKVSLFHYNCSPKNVCYTPHNKHSFQRLFFPLKHIPGQSLQLLISVFLLDIHSYLADSRIFGQDKLKTYTMESIEDYEDVATSTADESVG